MSFHWPYVLIALPLALAGLLALFAGSRRARERLLGQFASTRLLPMLLVSYNPALRRLKHGLIATGVLLAVFAMARPQWGYDWLEQRARGVDVVFVIDTSRSMLSQDVLPSRLERAKLAIFDSLEKMPGNRVGLVAFAGDAFLQCPLTLDYDAFRQTLEAVDTNTIAEGGTDLSVGLDVAAKALEDSGNHKIIVLLTDGEDLEGQGIGEAKVLADQGVTVYTIGVGTPAGEIIPVRDASGRTDFVRDERGEIVKSHLDSSTLTQIATATKGFYQPLGATGEGLARVYEDGVKKVPEQNLTSQMRRLPVERFQWFLTAGFVLLTLELLVGTRRPSWRRGPASAISLTEPIPVSAASTHSSTTKSAPSATSVAAGLLLLFAAIVFAPRATAADAPTDNSSPAPEASTLVPAPSGPKIAYSAKDAETLFQKGNYPTTADAYRQAAESAPQDSRFRYDQGESLYRTGDFEGAAQAFSKTLSSGDLTLQQRAYYNLGNSHFRLGESQMKDDPKKTVTTWESAVKDYQNALDLNSRDPDARYNLNLTQIRLDELKKKLEQQQQQQQNQSQNQDQKNQDQKDQDQKNQDQKNQDQQNQDQKNQDQQNQKNQDQNQQNKSDQQKQDNSSQNQKPNQNSPDKNNPSPNQSDKPNQDKQNSSGSPDQKNSPNPSNNGSQPKPQNGTGDKNPSPQNQPGQQKPPASQQNQPQPKPGQSSGQKPGDQAQAKSPQASGTSGKDPAQQAQGQSKPQPPAASGSSAPGASTQQAQATAGTAHMVGVMSRDEARQLLDSLKVYERKIPAAPAQGTSSQKSNPDQFHKDW